MPDDVQRFGGEVGGERRQQRQDRLDRRIVDADAAQGATRIAPIEPRDGEADDEASAGQQHELLGRLDEREDAGRHRGDRELERDEARRIVDEALAVQDVA